MSLAFLLQGKITVRGFTIFRAKCELHLGPTSEPLCNMELVSLRVAYERIMVVQMQSYHHQKGFLPARVTLSASPSSLGRSVGTSGLIRNGIFLQNPGHVGI